MADDALRDMFLDSVYDTMEEFLVSLECPDYPEPPQFPKLPKRHVHNCVDFPDHSAGSHLCECGVMWQGEHASPT
jgi:hypothetical protein